MMLMLVATGLEIFFMFSQPVCLTGNSLSVEKLDMHHSWFKVHQSKKILLSKTVSL